MGFAHGQLGWGIPLIRPSGTFSPAGRRGRIVALALVGRASG
jgi:hypothetical protein